MIFQVVYNMLHNGQIKTPLHTAIAECIHDTYKSKSLIQILNRLGLCTSYDDVERIDMAQTKRLVDLAVSKRVPVPEEIDDESTVNGAMDNFDHEENTPSGIGGSHDTILDLFQKSHKQEKPGEISHKPSELESFRDSRSLKHTLECQKLLKLGKFSTRGTIPSNFKPSEPPSMEELTERAKRHAESWFVLRYRDNRPGEDLVIPTFAAINSLLDDQPVIKTKIAFTPILPYVATQYDTIYTTMRNFQDVLQQRKQPYGPLWSDEGVYRLAKEIQLLNPEEFDNIFLGLGGFHFEKVLIACCGKYFARNRNRYRANRKRNLRAGECQYCRYRWALCARKSLYGYCIRSTANT